MFTKILYDLDLYGFQESTILKPFWMRGIQVYLLSVFLSPVNLWDIRPYSQLFVLTFRRQSVLWRPQPEDNWTVNNRLNRTLSATCRVGIKGRDTLSRRQDVCVILLGHSDMSLRLLHSVGDTSRRSPWLSDY